KIKEKADESDNNSNNILNDNSSNIVNDNTTSMHALSYTEPSCDTPSNINENCSLSTTIKATSGNKKRTYQKWQTEGSVAQQLFNASDLERQENRQRFSDLLDGAYFLFEHERPHTTLYELLLEVLTKID
ncbi:unnamed protein product, partial [Rotaria magnacalcarata]